MIVPVYNLAPYVGECLDGLVRQETDFPFEIIVGDDGSTDGSRAVAEAFAADWPDRVRLLPAGPNVGLVANLKRLMGEVRGRYVAYLDGDDVALPGKLAAEVDHLERHPDCAIVYHESEMFDSASGARIRDYSKGGYNWSHIPPRATIEHLVRYGTFLQASAVMFRAHEHLVEAVLPGCTVIADYPLAVMTAGYLGGTIDFIDRTLGRYRMHGTSSTSANARSKERRLRAMEDIIAACEAARRFGVSEETVAAGKAHAIYAAALYFLRQREDELFRALIERSAEGGFRFDARHAMAWSMRASPDAARATFFGA